MPYYPYMSQNTDLHKLHAWLSPAYPVGAFSYSHGLEFAVTTGDVTNASELQAWVTDVTLLGSGRNDVILLSHAYRADSDDALNQLAALAEALAPSRERHLEAMAQGAAFARTTSDVWTDEMQGMPYPVAIGVAARNHGIAIESTASLYLHSFVANIISAGVRFIPLGQTEGQKVLAALFEPIEKLVATALTLSLEDLGSTAFRADMASMQHETMQTRIFRS